MWQNVKNQVITDMDGATGGCGGQCPLLLGPAGYRGYRGGPMKMIFASMFINATTRQQISIYSIGPY